MLVKYKPDKLKPKPHMPSTMLIQFAPKRESRFIFTKLISHHFTSFTVCFIVCLFCYRSNLQAQDHLPEAKRAAIIFPYPMYKEKWRSSIGISMLTTPEDITEEVRVRVPAVDVRFLRRITSRFILDAKLSAQILQNQMQLGFHWILPVVNERLFLSVGNDVGYWFGFLTVEGFNSKGSGWLAYPNLSLGWRTPGDLLVTFRAQSSINLYYKAYNGNEEASLGKSFYNGETFTIALEQPFYHHRHLALAFSAINNYFYWQTWPLFYRVDRKIFYPQITVALIL